MVKDAEVNAAEDKKKLELVQARNQGEAMVHSVRKSLTEYGDKLDAGEKDKIEAAAKELEETLKSEDKDAIEAKTNALMTASQKLGEKMYEAQQAAGCGRAGAGTGRRSAAGGSRPTTTTSSTRKSRKSRRVETGRWRAGRTRRVRHSRLRGGGRRGVLAELYTNNGHANATTTKSWASPRTPRTTRSRRLIASWR